MIRISSRVLGETGGSFKSGFIFRGDASKEMFRAKVNAAPVATWSGKSSWALKVSLVSYLRSGLGLREV